MKPWCSLILGLFISSAISQISVGIALPVKAQIIPDGTTNTTLTPTDNGIEIDQGNRAGDNLFHSFQEFSVPNGSEAFFNNPSDILNIFSRVTGGNISNIDGLIRANGDANLFLINPAGIVFGENASLDIGGSFVGSTADSIVFTDDVDFLATDGDNPPLLTINMPIGLNFGNNPGEIAVNGSNLPVNSGETLALLGGNVTITGGQIIAPGANIELGGLTEAGQVSFERLGDEISFSSISFPEVIPRGDITLTNGAEVNVKAAGGGNIRVNARNLELSGGELGASNLSAGIAPESDSTEAQAGDVILNATNNITTSQGSRIFNQVEELGVGNAGKIMLTANNLSFTEGAQVNASTFGQGDGGAIIIEASDTIEADGQGQDGFSSGILNLVERSAVGNSGGIDITTVNLKLTQGAEVNASTLGQGDAGAIMIEASDSIEADGQGQDGSNSGILNLVEELAEGNSGGIDITTVNLKLTQDAKVDASSFGRGDAGEIDITTANLELTEGGQVNASTFFGQGNAGAITIKASDTIEADGEGPDGFSSGILSIVTESARGNSGGINITTTNLKLTRGAEVNASILAGSQGDAGKIIIKANSTIEADGVGLDTFGSGIFSVVDAVGTGNRGGIDITTTNLKLTRGAEVNASAFFGQRDAGRINITTDNLSLTEGAQINANTSSQGDGGEINIKANGTIEADGEREREGQDEISSGIFSLVKESAEGNSGGINITTTNLKLTRGAEVNASTVFSQIGRGDAGEIIIKAEGTIEADGQGQDGFGSGIFSVVDAVGTGNPGGINITTTNLKLTRGAEVNASTFFGQRDAGGINITTDNLYLTEGGQINASTFGQGNAGAIIVKANDTIEADGEGQDGSRSGIFSRPGESAEGNAGGIDIDTSNLSLENNAEISVESLGQVNAGNLVIKANSLSLESGASLFASTPMGTGGNINLQIAEELILRDNSTISAQALENANGGNIDLDANFVIAFSNQNNDIIASAAQGTGGNIDITTNAIFGLEARNSTPPNNTNDIDTSSEFGLDGTVEINELEVNPAEGLEELPVEIIDVTRLVEQNLCQQAKDSEFIVTGKGGIAPSPTQPRDGEISEVNLVEPASFAEDEEIVGAQGLHPAKEEIVEAQGWMINDRGIVELVAHKTSPDGNPPQPKNAIICAK